MADKQPKRTWKSSQNHLSQALEEWSTISKTVQAEGKMAPDEKMLKDIEGLLVELKSKLDIFSSPATQDFNEEVASPEADEQR